MDEFARDDVFQRKVRDAVLAPGYYGQFATEGRYVFIDKGRCATLFQKRFAVDTIVQGKAGAALCIEEKIVRWPGYDYEKQVTIAPGYDYKDICLETESCTNPGHESPGWMTYGKADFLLYAMMKPDRLEIGLYDFEQLQRWFWPLVETFKVFQMPKNNRTRGRRVPIETIKRAQIPCWFRTVYPDVSHALTAELFPGLAEQRTEFVRQYVRRYRPAERPSP